MKAFFLLTLAFVLSASSVSADDPGADGAAYKIVFTHAGDAVLGPLGLFWRDQSRSKLQGDASLPFATERFVGSLNAGDTVAHVTNDNHRFDVRSSDFKLRFQLAVGPSPDGEYDFSLLLRNVMAEHRGDEDERLQLFYDGNEVASVGGSEDHEEVCNHSHAFTVKYNDEPILTVTIYGPQNDRSEL